MPSTPSVPRQAADTASLRMLSEAVVTAGGRLLVLMRSPRPDQLQINARLQEYVRLLGMLGNLCDATLSGMDLDPVALRKLAARDTVPHQPGDYFPDIITVTDYLEVPT